MKEKKEKRLGLNKKTIQNLYTILERDDQRKVKGGSGQQQPGTTEVPFHC
jgi:hypothetical protein